MLQLLKAVEHMHKYGFFHRDIKPENILIKVTWLIYDLWKTLVYAESNRFSLGQFTQTGRFRFSQKDQHKASVHRVHFD